MKHGDITEEKGEVFVNSIGVEVSFDGPIAQCAIKECGEGIVEEAKDAARKKNKKGIAE